MYAALADLKSRLGSQVSPPGLYQQLTDRVAFTTGDDAVGQDILDGAHGEVNGYLARRYAVPVEVSADSTLAQHLKKLVLDVAEKVAWDGCAGRMEIPDRVTTKYAAAIKFLEGVATGRLVLAGAAEIPPATNDGPGVQTIGNEPVYTEDSIKDI